MNKWKGKNRVKAGLIKALSEIHKLNATQIMFCHTAQRHKLEYKNKGEI